MQNAECRMQNAERPSSFNVLRSAFCIQETFDLAGHKLQAMPAALGAIALLAFSSFVEPVTGLNFVLVPAGAFQMGSPASEPGHRPDERLHTVRFSQPVYVAATEVTQ